MVPSSWAAPVNDNFADQIQVFNGSTNSVTGSNVAATMEAGEPVPAGYTPSNYQGTVWYLFKPAADIWYEINTVGSAVDTVLALWTGTGLNDLQLVHVNNEAAEGGVSRIRFQSHGAPDASYFISVAGHDGSAQGSLKLTIQPGGNQMIIPEPSITLSPSTVDVGTTGSTTVSITMSVTSDVATGYVKLYSADGTQVTSATYSVGNRTSGNNSSGLYNVSLPLSNSLASGTYVLGMQAQNAVSSPSKADSYGWDQMTALGIPATLTIQNSKYAYTQFTIDNSLVGTAAAKTADPDKDGMKNLEEFAFGLNPSLSDVAPLVLSGSTLVRRGVPITLLIGTGNQQRLRVEFIRRVAGSQTPPTYVVEFSDDLVNWTPATNAAVVLATSGAFEAVSVDDITTGTQRTKRFAHVVITY
ncbi:MAG: conserved repeat domain protein [Verrucomicrobiaceae bacterium]|nr:conserved repeat domain protein [Verrucomicrobiaceae bacterium]